MPYSTKALIASEISSREQKNSIRTITVSYNDISYSFDVINVIEIISGITIPDEEHDSGWMIVSYKNTTVLAFDLRETCTKANDSLATIVRTNVLRYGTISSMVFIVEDEDRFYNKRCP